MTWSGGDLLTYGVATGALPNTPGPIKKRNCIKTNLMIMNPRHEISFEAPDDCQYICTNSTVDTPALHGRITTQMMTCIVAVIVPVACSCWRHQYRCNGTTPCLRWYMRMAYKDTYDQHYTIKHKNGRKPRGRTFLPMPNGSSPHTICLSLCMIAWFLSAD